MEKKKELVDKLGELINSSDDLSLHLDEIKQLRAEFVNLVREDHEKLKKDFKPESEDDEFKPSHDDLDSKFSDLMAAYNQKKKKYDDRGISRPAYQIV